MQNKQCTPSEICHSLRQGWTSYGCWPV